MGAGLQIIAIYLYLAAVQAAAIYWIGKYRGPNPRSSGMTDGATLAVALFLGFAWPMPVILGLNIVTIACGGLFRLFGGRFGNETGVREWVT